MPSYAAQTIFQHLRQLEFSLGHLKSSSSKKLVKIIHELEETIVILDYVNRELKRRQEVLLEQDGFKGLRILDKSFWRFSSPRKQLTVTTQCDSFTNNEDNEEFLNEKITDTCLLEVTQQRTGECMISNDCWDAMVENMDCSGYSGTHQLLFMVTSWRMQCESLFPPSLEDLMTNCSFEMFSHFCEIKSRNFPSDLQDVFLEYVTMGALAGFDRFLEQDSFLQVLQWQNRDGCFYVKNFKGPAQKEITRTIHKTAIASAFLGVYASHFALVENNKSVQQ